MTRADDKRRANFHRMTQTLDRLEADLHSAVARGERIPPEWHEIALGGGQGAKVKVTLWVEAEVLAFFRAMGAGHTSRMADVLKTFLHARLAGVVKGPEDVECGAQVGGAQAGVDAVARLKASTAALVEALRREREG